MIYISSKDNKINYSPQNELEEIQDNVRMILMVCKEEQPLNRDFAFDCDLIDKNINIVENKLNSHLLNLFRKYEPRARLKKTQIKSKNIHNNDFEIVLGIEVIT